MLHYGKYKYKAWVILNFMHKVTRGRLQNNGHSRWCRPWPPWQCLHKLNTKGVIKVDFIASQYWAGIWSIDACTATKVFICQFSQAKQIKPPHPNSPKVFSPQDMSPFYYEWNWNGSNISFSDNSIEEETRHHKSLLLYVRSSSSIQTLPLFSCVVCTPINLPFWFLKNFKSQPVHLNNNLRFFLWILEIIWHYTSGFRNCGHAGGSERTSKWSGRGDWHRWD